MKKINSIIFTGLLLASAAANSQIITVDYVGNVTAVGSMLTGDGVSIGNGVSGSFSYDTEMNGVLSAFTISIGGFSAVMSGAGVLSVQNDQQNGSATLPADGLTVFTGSTTSPALNGYTNPSMQFGLLKENVAGQLWNDTLPPDTADWAGVSIADVNAADWHWMDFGLSTTHFSDDQIRWNVEAFRVSAQDGVPAVPVPAAVWLFGSGLAGLLGAARRKARS